MTITSIPPQPPASPYGLPLNTTMQTIATLAVVVVAAVAGAIIEPLFLSGFASVGLAATTLWWSARSRLTVQRRDGGVAAPAAAYAD